MTGKKLDLENLQRTLKAAAVNNPGRASVVIRADRRVALDYVVAAINACYKVNIRDYRLTTMEGGGSYNQTDAEGFLQIQGLPSRVQARLHPRDY